MMPGFSSRGYTDILFLALATFFGVLIAGGFSVISNNPQNASISATIASPTPYNAHTSLQLGSFGFTAITPAPASCIGNFNIVSNESSVMYAWDPPPNGSAKPGGKIKVWATDEHSITIGQSGNGQTATASTIVPDHANPAPVGDLNAKDCGPGSARGACLTGEIPLPLFPAIYLVDLTANPSAISADAFKNSPHPVNEVWGSWKPFPDNNYPPRNGLNVGGGDPFPPNPFPLTIPDAKGRGHDKEYGTELIWNVDQLGLTTGHNYAAVFVVHDGDNSPGADLGLGCTTINF